MQASVAPTRASALLGALNPAQRTAVEHDDGPLLVLAGAGSGKTRVLTLRIVRMIQDRGIDPAQILAVTFTNKAAGEMRDRMELLLGARPAGMWMGTFHSTGARLLRANAGLVGRTSNFTIYDEDDTLGLVKRVMEAKGITQVELHRETAIPKSTISEILMGKKPFSRTIIRTLADYFQVSVGVLAANL